LNYNKITINDVRAIKTVIVFGFKIQWRQLRAGSSPASGIFSDNNEKPCSARLFLVLNIFKEINFHIFQMIVIA
jgi:hypothetical protein